MKHIFDNVSDKCSKLTTIAYKTSFSFGIKALDKRLFSHLRHLWLRQICRRNSDTFLPHKHRLFYKFKKDTIDAIQSGISLNPILKAKKVVNEYNIEWEPINTFLESMEMDLDEFQTYDTDKYNKYSLGSAEVVGFRCLKVFVNGNNEQYENLKPSAMSLGAAFQKVNFLRDANSDFSYLGRTYFPGVNMVEFNEEDKLKIENDIEIDFKDALEGIKQLPYSSREETDLYLRIYISRPFSTGTMFVE